MNLTHPFHACRITAACLCLTLVPWSAPCAAAGGPQPGEDPLVPGEALVRPTPGTTIDTFLAAMNLTFDGTTVIAAVPSRQTYKLALPPGASAIAVESYLEQQSMAGGLLVWGELNYEGQAAEGKTQDIWSVQLSVGPAQFDGQYAGSLLELVTAHEKSQGQGVVVAVLDTGVDFTHPALAMMEAPGGANFVPGATPGAPTNDVGDGQDNDGDGAVDEMVGHGTFIAGLVALVAPQARILPVAVLDSEGIGDTFSIAQGIYHAIDSGAAVINCSFGSTYKGQAVEDAVTEAMLKGIVVIGAAGNFDREEPEEFPALIDGAIGVAATDAQDLKANFSNFNDKMLISAPGDSATLPGFPGIWDPAESIVGPLASSIQGEAGSAWGVWEGTSFATGFVSGVAALVRAQYPSAPANAATTALILGAVVDGSDPIDALNPQYARLLGAGRLNAAGAVAPGPPAPTAGDLNADGVIDGGDLGVLLANWGGCPTTPPCVGDLNGDGAIDGADLGALLALWSE